MGGQYKIFPKKIRIVLIFQLILQMFFYYNYFADGKVYATMVLV